MVWIVELVRDGQVVSFCEVVADHNKEALVKANRIFEFRNAGTGKMVARKK